MTGTFSCGDGKEGRASNDSLWQKAHPENRALANAVRSKVQSFLEACKQSLHELADGDELAVGCSFSRKVNSKVLTVMCGEVHPWPPISGESCRNRPFLDYQPRSSPGHLTFAIWFSASWSAPSAPIAELFDSLCVFGGVGPLARSVTCTALVPPSSLISRQTVTGATDALPAASASRFFMQSTPEVDLRVPHPCRAFHDRVGNLTCSRVRNQKSS